MPPKKSGTKDKNETVQVWNFKGKYADYMRILYDEEGDEFHVIFDKIYHGYAFCALYGLIKGRRHIYDPLVDNPNDSSPLGFRWTSADSSGLYSYDTLRKLILLYSKSNDMSFEAKIDRALRYDYSTNDIKDPDLIEKSQYGDNSDLIDEFVLGGLELLYEKIASISSREAMIDFMKETMEEFQDLIK